MEATQPTEPNTDPNRAPPIAQLRCMRKVLGTPCHRPADRAATIVIPGKPELRTDVVACPECAAALSSVLDLISMQQWNTLTANLRLAIPPSAGSVRWDEFGDLDVAGAMEMAEGLTQAAIERLVAMRVKPSPLTAHLMFIAALTMAARFTEDAELDRETCANQAHKFFMSLDKLTEGVAGLGDATLASLEEMVKCDECDAIFPVNQTGSTYDGESGAHFCAKCSATDLGHLIDVEPPSVGPQGDLT